MDSSCCYISRSYKNFPFAYPVNSFVISYPTNSGVVCVDSYSLYCYPILTSLYNISAQIYVRQLLEI